MLSKTSKAKLLNKIDSSSVSKNGKAEAVYGLLHCLNSGKLCACWRFGVQRGVVETLAIISE